MVVQYEFRMGRHKIVLIFYDLICYLPMLSERFVCLLGTSFVAMHIHCLNQILCLFAAADLNSINESSFSLFSFQLSMRDDHAAEINKSLVSSSSGKETEHQHHKILINKQSIGIRPTPRRSSMMIPMT